MASSAARAVSAAVSATRTPGGSVIQATPWLTLARSFNPGRRTRRGIERRGTHCRPSRRRSARAPRAPRRLHNSCAGTAERRPREPRSKPAETRAARTIAANGLAAAPRPRRGPGMRRERKSLDGGVETLRQRLDVPPPRRELGLQGSVPRPSTSSTTAACRRLGRRVATGNVPGWGSPAPNRRLPSTSTGQQLNSAASMTTRSGPGSGSRRRRRPPRRASGGPGASPLASARRLPSQPRAVSVSRACTPARYPSVSPDELPRSRLIDPRQRGRDDLVGRGVAVCQASTTSAKAPARRLAADPVVPVLDGARCRVEFGRAGQAVAFMKVAGHGPARPPPAFPSSARTATGRPRSSAAARVNT